MERGDIPGCHISIFIVVHLRIDNRQQFQMHARFVIFILALENYVENVGDRCLYYTGQDRECLQTVYLLCRQLVSDI